MNKKLIAKQLWY